MDSIVYEDTPLAAYLEGEGDGGETISMLPKELESDSEPSFAPRGPSTVRSRVRRSLQKIKSIRVPSNRSFERISSILSTKPTTQDNEAFLEQFRYTIIASQLLGEPITSLRPVDKAASSRLEPLANGRSRDLSPEGVVITASGAFLLVWILYWARGGKNPQFSRNRWITASVVLLAMGVIVWANIRRQLVFALRARALKQCSEFIATANSFDGTVLAGLALIQEVEVVSRGYRMTSPLPPISRLDETTEVRRCNRLRKALHESIIACLESFAQAYDSLRELADKPDLDRYFDIYDIEQQTLEEIRRGADLSFHFPDTESLQSLKDIYRRAHGLRKVLFCTLLAISSDGGRIDSLKWRTALLTLSKLEAPFVAGEKRLRDILDEEDFQPCSPPKIITLDSGREKAREQMRKFNALSLGIRGLQAKMHILREDSDRSLDETDEVKQSGESLMQQYESIGEDLRMLMHEWETGKSALVSSIDKNERRVSSLISPTLSLGGITEVSSGSPADALKTLNGDISREMSSDEEIFEAVAIPKQRSTLSREERIAKMKEDRIRIAANRESREANTRMLKELETVINLRPRKSTSGRVTSI